MDIYFDNAATSPLAKEVRDVMVELMDSSFGNPSSIHKKGREASGARREKSRRI